MAKHHTETKAVINLSKTEFQIQSETGLSFSVQIRSAMNYFSMMTDQPHVTCNMDEKY